MNRKSILHYACEKKSSYQIIEFLINANCDLNARDIGILFQIFASIFSFQQKFSDKCTPLHNACFNRNLDISIIELLIFKKASVNLLDNDNFTPKQYLEDNPSFKQNTKKFETCNIFWIQWKLKKNFPIKIKKKMLNTFSSLACHLLISVNGKIISFGVIKKRKFSFGNV